MNSKVKLLLYAALFIFICGCARALFTQPETTQRIIYSSSSYITYNTNGVEYVYRDETVTVYLTNYITYQSNYLARCDWDKDGVFDTGWLTNSVFQHIYSYPGYYTPEFEVMDTSNNIISTNIAVIVDYKTNDYFPTSVVSSTQGPGQYANNTAFRIAGNEDLLLGAPTGGGTVSPNNSSIITLGMGGGQVTLYYEYPILNHPDNISEYDFIVFGNALWASGDPEYHGQEPGVIRVAEDVNGNGIPDDPWYVIRGGSLSSGQYLNPSAATNVTYESNVFPTQGAYFPTGYSNPYSLDFIPLYFSLSQLSADELFGFCDVTPTLQCGDMNGDNDVSDAGDMPAISPRLFYSMPDRHDVIGIDAGSCGGDAIKLEWAYNELTGMPADDLTQVHFIQIVSPMVLTGPTGDVSPEVDAVVRVRMQYSR